MGEPPVDRQSIHDEMERARASFHTLVSEASASDLDRASDGTRWTNRQLLFHMLFGYMIVRTLLRLVRMFGRLPDGFSRTFARVLNSGTRPFHVVNYLGPRGGAVVFRGPRLTAKLDRTIASLHRHLDKETEDALGGGMHFPVGWDPFFHDKMSLADVYHYGTQHFDFHRRQLTLDRRRSVLSTWRTRALPLDLVERAVHQAILRTFAATSQPPARAELDEVTADSATTTSAVLKSLHDVDAIRLDRDNQIAVAYPFSATPTRHRVRIGDRVDLYAMCAIDALGMSAMLGEDTEISSVDVTTGRPITVTTINGQASWEPAGAVVFIGVVGGGGPSADCCCDYLNFFTDTAAAEAWTISHPQVPGQVLTQTEAEQLGSRLFQQLLAT